MTEVTKGKTHIPVYLSRFCDLPKDYGALVGWNIDQRVQFESQGKTVTGTIKSETRTHVEAPMIDGARGLGRWIREVLCDDTCQLAAISESRLMDTNQ